MGRMIVGLLLLAAAATACAAAPRQHPAARSAGGAAGPAQDAHPAGGRHRADAVRLPLEGRRQAQRYAHRPAHRHSARPTQTAAQADPQPPARQEQPVNHCARNRLAQRVIVSIAAQHMWMCAQHRTVYSTPVTTGMSGAYTETPTGNYWIQGRDRNTVLNTYLGDGRYKQYPVKFWIPFDAPLFGFHDASWQRFPFGSPKYRAHGSHGCVHMPLAAIRWLYHWVARPTAVRIL